MAATAVKPGWPVRRMMLLLACPQTALIRNQNQAWRPTSCAAGRQAEVLLHPSELERGRGYVIGSDEGHTLGCRDRRRQGPQEWRSTVVDFPTNQHGIVFVDCVMAVLHEHAAPIAELHGQGHASTRTQAIDVLAAFLPSRNVSSATVTGQDLAFFKVDVDRVIPTAATVLQCPHFAGTVGWGCGDTAEAGIQHLAVVGLHAPLTFLPA